MGMPNVVPLLQGEFWTGEPSAFTTNPKMNVKRGDLIYVGQGEKMLKWVVARADGEAEAPVVGAISGSGKVTYGRVFAGRWKQPSSSASQPCVRCVNGQRPAGVSPLVPCCPARN